MKQMIIKLFNIFKISFATLCTVS